MSELRVISASQVNTFRLCPLQWWFRHVAREPETRRGAPLVVGTVVDVAIKAAVHAIRGGEASAEGLDVETLFASAWNGEAESPKVPIEWGEKGEDAIKATTHDLVVAFLRRPDLAKWVSRIEAVDLRVDLPVLDPVTGGEVPNLRIVGILDFVERDESGLVMPLEIKTGANRGILNALETHLQLCVYSDSLRRVRQGVSTSIAVELGVKTKTVAWERRVVSLTDAARRHAIASVIAVARAMSLNAIYAAPSWACGSCSWRRQCEGFGETVRPHRDCDPFAA